MFVNIIFCFVLLKLDFMEAFFLFADKSEPIFFCYKICPLYCSPRRHDLDESSLIYIEDEQPHPYFDHSPNEYHAPLHFGHYFFCKTTTTTPKPTTTTTQAPTTEEPSWICMTCMDKCRYGKIKKE
ncbi:uncharacterized protein LOC119630713 [Bombyx mori]|uniref:uncharacterized protein LOC119630713 n=1 Tax=Bombyx mori TaxID=7091 RepID=UPI002ED41D3F